MRIYLIIALITFAAGTALANTGVQGGIIVQLGVDSGKQLEALKKNDSYTVHALEKDPAKVQAAREYLLSKGLYGDISVEQFSGDKLPYADDLINQVVVVSNKLNVNSSEIMRVLVPNGVAIIDGKTITKPLSKDIDSWTHFLHDAGNNPVAQDKRVGPPRRLQWSAPPNFLRSHETPSGFQGLVSDKGRVFYFLDEGLVGIVDPRLPERWSLIARDAFNGKLLWKQSMPNWGWPAWDPGMMKFKDLLKQRALRKAVPKQNFRRMVVAGDRLLVTLGYNAPVSILDAATGKKLSAIKGSANTRKILASGDYALLKNDKAIVIKINTAEIMWQKPLNGSFAMVGNHLYCGTGKQLKCLNIADGKEIWSTNTKTGSDMIAVKDTVLVFAGNKLTAFNSSDGKLLWTIADIRKKFAVGANAAYVVNDVIWFGPKRRTGSTAQAAAVDLKTGKTIKILKVPKLLSPEHHHRCYRNKATERYIISGMEGAEYMNLDGDEHAMNNFVRGACVQGIVPCNGFLYAPPDQCFCEPGAKLLGFNALAAEAKVAAKPAQDSRRLTKGPAFGRRKTVNGKQKTGGDWATYRGNNSRWGSSKTEVGKKVETAWKTEIGDALTAAVAAGDKVYVAGKNSHTIYALGSKKGKIEWTFSAGGRIDSPPTIYNGLVLFGSKDGYVYCATADKGELLWKFLAAYYDRRIGIDDQLESAWPVHGGVLIKDDKVYFSAGRSTYLDGGIYFYALNPHTGEIIHKGHIEGPHPDVTKNRDKSFYITGANSEPLVSEGDFIYMRQKKLTPDLKEVDIPVLSSKGAQDPGLHLFSTASMLDGSWYNRTFWMYSKRWPGFQLAVQSPKAGQIISVDDEKTYTLRVFYRRNVHSPFFFPETDGYLLFADKNSNEPQIVGEKGSQKPIEWLPQSDYSYAHANKTIKLGSKAFGRDKMIGYSRVEPPLWETWIKVRVRAMAKTKEHIFVAGPPDVLDEDDPYAAFEGRKGAELIVISAKDGEVLSQLKLDSPPVFDGLIAANESLYASLEDGSIIALR